MTAQPTIARRQATTVTRDITVLNRYKVNQDCPEKDLHAGDVVLHIRNDKGAEYYTTLRRTKRHECTCPSYKPCYHIARMTVVENARWEAAQAAKAEQTKRQVEELAQAKAVAKVVDLASAREAKEAKSSKDKVVAMMNAPLTKNNKAFSILR